MSDSNTPNSPANVEIYTTRLCPFCVMAKQLLTQKQIAFTEIAVDGDPAARQRMEQLSGGYTVPQIFINSQPIGGCDDLYRLDASGQLQPLLNSTTRR